MLLPLVWTNSDHFRLSGIINTYQCEQIHQAPQSLHDFVAPSKISTGLLCDTTTNFFRNGKILRLTLDQNTTIENNVTYSTSKVLTLAVDAQNNIVSPLFPQGLLTYILLGLGSAFLLSRWHGKTPGKVLLGLQVTGLTKGAALRREIARLLPLTIPQVFILLPPALMAGMVNHINLFTGVMALYALLLGWYYLWPFIRWTGQSRHDRLAGTKVIQK